MRAWFVSMYAAFASRNIRQGREMMKAVCLIFACLLTLISVSPSDAKEWRGIKPLDSTLVQTMFDFGLIDAILG